MSNLRILIADDHALFRSGLREIIAEFEGVVKIDEAASGPEVLKKFNESKFDCVLLDIYMPGSHGIEILKQLKSINPRVHVLILSMYPEDQYGIRALKAGASGYLTKNATPGILREAVGRVCKGLKYIPPSLVEILCGEIQSGGGGRLHDRLTDRELQILTMIASGKTVSQVARDLYLSAKTISTHRANILRKTGLKNNSELIRYAVKNSLVI
ncbi:MAG: response regulator transcription factor [Candidatus Aminicenantales bacterium]